MKKVLFVLACLICSLTTRAEDSLLWWIVESKNVDGEIASYNNAHLWASANGTTKEIGRLNSDELTDQVIGTGVIDSLLKDSCSYWVELLSGETLVGKSEIQTFNDLQYYFATTGSNPPGGAWSPVITAVPEPTSGMLLLFGLAGLALRRRQKV